MSNKICAYGTLRKLQVNYLNIVRIYGIENYCYNYTITLKGYTMFNLSYYPTIYKTGDPDDKIIAEVFTCSDEVYDYIKNMEVNAGYYEEFIIINDVFHAIYAMNSIPITANPIKSGNWLDLEEEVMNFHDFCS